jgi:hypothetical protein
LDEDQQPARTQLFMVRVWIEDLGEGRTEWRGKVQHALSGEACYFRDWASLIAFLDERLPGTSAQAWRPG